MSPHLVLHFYSASEKLMHQVSATKTQSKLISHTINHIPLQKQCEEMQGGLRYMSLDEPKASTVDLYFP